MSALTDRELKGILDKELVIHPCEEDTCFSSKGYDLRVGYALALNKEAHATAASETSTITIPPGTSAFIITKEYVWLSKKLVGTFHARGKLAAQGLFIDSTMIDSLWQGQLLFLVYNAASERDVVLQVGEPFITMMLHRVAIPTTSPRPASFMEVVQERGRFYGESFMHKLIAHLLDAEEQRIKADFEERIQKAQSLSLPAHLLYSLKTFYSVIGRYFPRKVGKAFIGLMWVFAIGLLSASVTLGLYWSWLQTLLHSHDPYGGAIVIGQIASAAASLAALIALWGLWKQV